MENGNLKSLPLFFEVPGKVMVSGKVIGVGKSGVETNVERVK